MKYGRLIAEFYSQVWGLRPETFFTMQELIRMWGAGLKFDEKEVRSRIDASNEAQHFYAGPRGGTSQPGGVAVIPIVGVISNRMNMVSEISGGGGSSIQKLTSQFRQALGDDRVKTIVFDVDSPGGSVEGAFELASEIFNARGKKRTIAVANAQAASAAYLLASAAGELVVTLSGQVGSIGVYAAHQDESKALEAEGVKITYVSAGKYKTEGNPTEPLSDEARQALQEKVNDYYGMFVKAVATHRGDSQAKVRGGYGEGRMVMAQKAVKENMADRVATLDDVLGQFGTSTTQLAQASAGTAAIQAAIPDDRDEDEPDLCGCNCSACEGCEFKDDGKAKARAKADDGSMCECTCDACKACENKGGAKGAAVNPEVERRRREMQLFT
jgi:capsid assembly protease